MHQQFPSSQAKHAVSGAEHENNPALESLGIQRKEVLQRGRAGRKNFRHSKSYLVETGSKMGHNLGSFGQILLYCTFSYISERSSSHLCQRRRYPAVRARRICLERWSRPLVPLVDWPPRAAAGTETGAGTGPGGGSDLRSPR